MRQLLSDIRQQQKLAVLDLKNPLPGPVVSGHQAIWNLIMTGKEVKPVVEVWS